MVSRDHTTVSGPHVSNSILLDHGGAVSQKLRQVVHCRHCARLMISICGARQVQMDMEMLDALSSPLEVTPFGSVGRSVRRWIWIDDLLVGKYQKRIEKVLSTRITGHGLTCLKIDTEEILPIALLNISLSQCQAHGCHGLHEAIFPLRYILYLQKSLTVGKTKTKNAPSFYSHFPWKFPQQHVTVSLIVVAEYAVWQVVRHLAFSLCCCTLRQGGSGRQSPVRPERVDGRFSCSIYPDFD